MNSGVPSVMSTDFDTENGGAKMFVGGLPQSVTSETLRNYFSSFGAIQEAFVLMDETSGRSRGFGFVTFDNNNTLNHVLSKRPHVLGAKQVDCKHAVLRAKERQSLNGSLQQHPHQPSSHQPNSHQQNSHQQNSHNQNAHNSSPHQPNPPHLQQTGAVYAPYPSGYGGQQQLSGPQMPMNDGNPGGFARPPPPQNMMLEQHQAYGDLGPPPGLQPAGALPGYGENYLPPSYGNHPQSKPGIDQWHGSPQSSGMHMGSSGAMISSGGGPPFSMPPNGSLGPAMEQMHQNQGMPPPIQDGRHSPHLWPSGSQQFPGENRGVGPSGRVSDGGRGSDMSEGVAESEQEFFLTGGGKSYLALSGDQWLEDCAEADERKIFVGGLPDVTPAEFASFFEHFGPVSDAMVMFDRKRRRQRGFGFITFATGDGVHNALRHNRHPVKGKLVEVKKAHPLVLQKARAPAKREQELAKLAAAAAADAQSQNQLSANQQPIGAYAPATNASTDATTTGSEKAYGAAAAVPAVPARQSLAEQTPIDPFGIAYRANEAPLPPDKRGPVYFTDAPWNQVRNYTPYYPGFQATAQHY